MIIDLDSHLRDQYFLDEIYQLDGPYAQFTPTRVGSGKYQQSNFDHSIDPRPRKAMAVFDHRYMSDPDKKWRGGEYSERQRGGWDLERRLKDKTLEKIDRQILFPTNITIPTSNFGGLGLALGTLGMAAVLLRNVFEQRRELALLRAVGYNSSHFALMVISENVLMLCCGLAVGFVCALLAIAPVLLERGGRLPNVSLGLLLLAVLLSGAIASLVATLAALRSPLLPALRAE